MAKKSNSSDSTGDQGGFWSRLFNRSFIVQLLLIGIFLFGCLLLAFGWLKIYTNHGQKLVLPNYEKKALLEAEQDAKSKSFEIFITDSIHHLDYPGGIILSQNPPPNSMVKEKRKIYVTTTKFQPDLIDLNEIPSLYGNPYTSMRQLIEGFGLKTVIQDYRYDSGPENTILEVLYNGEVIINREGKKPRFKIEKGGTLNFILAKSSGGLTNIPDLRCSEFATAEFLADSYRLVLEVIDEDQIFNGDYAGTYVTKQIPPYDPEQNLLMNDSIKVYLSSTKPADCEDTFVPKEDIN